MEENYEVNMEATENGETGSAAEGLTKETMLVIGGIAVAGAAAGKLAEVAWKKAVKPVGKKVFSGVKSLFTKKEKEPAQETEKEIKIVKNDDLPEETETKTEEEAKTEE